jgi:hypothetical protein
MTIIRLYMTMSLDGYVTGPQDSPDTPMGIRQEWLEHGLSTQPADRRTAERSLDRPELIRTEPVPGTWHEEVRIQRDGVRYRDGWHPLMT